MNKRNISILVALSLTVTASSAANAVSSFCFAPSAPYLFITKPNKPYCAAARSCSDWEVRSYKNDVDRYFNQLKTHLADVDKYAKDSYAYVECMADLD